MPIEHLSPDVVPTAGPPHVSIATGSKLVFFSGQVGRMADGTPAADTVKDLRPEHLQDLYAAVVD